MRRGAAVLGAAAVIVGCMASSSGISSAAATSGRVPATHRVRIAGFRYQPDTLRVTSGDTVVFVNTDQFGHTASSRSGALETSLISAGDSARWVAESPVTIVYDCTFHPSMRGMVIVTAP